ncbi:MAG TPA: histidinol dehydrogenase [Advenella kashmirensis]|uniref:Histidinol dehydrogenase n=2 Tax=Advenella TaxID=290425 RepID=A0A356LLT3_9BURK|nr:histidinol dehydrogenase [Advenella kashmirensis]
MMSEVIFKRVEFIKKPAAHQQNTLESIEGTVKEIINAVRKNGDAAVRQFSEKFDNAFDIELEVTADEKHEAVNNLDQQTREDTLFAIEQVRKFAQAQLATMLPLEVENLPGVHLGHKIIPIERIGAYVPGGRYPILSAPVMTIVPAKVAGCDEVIACLPPGAHQAMIAGCHLAGADRIFRIGGAQAIAAMAYGTDSVPAVDKIVGPGNAFVNEAKRQVFGQVGIDQLAGPSEIFIVADETADPAMVACDLLAQAEHDVHTRVGLITTSKNLAQNTLSQVNIQMQALATADVASKAWSDFGEIVLCPHENAMHAYSDYVAAEHLQIHTRAPHETAKQLRNYGSLFIGENASVVYSDKCCGTNHTLPTMRAGRYTGGLWVGSYVKVCTHQWMEQSGIESVAPPAIRQSQTEGMEGHRKAAEYRLRRHPG